MNYQLLYKFPINYQLDQNRASNYQSYSFFPLPSVRWVKSNGQCVMCESRVFLIYFLPILPSSSSVLSLSLSLISFFIYLRRMVSFVGDQTIKPPPTRAFNLPSRHSRVLCEQRERERDR
jgi:hypothetical protein